MSLGKKKNDDHIVTGWVLEDNHKKSHVIKFCKRHHLKILSYRDGHLKVKGTTKNFNKIFETEIHNFSHNNKIHHKPIKAVKMPKYVKHIFGLDTKEKLRPYYHVQKATNTNTFTPLQLATLYNFPDSTGKGQKIGIIELGGGYKLKDIQTYFKSLNLNFSPKITDVSVDQAKNNPADGTGANVEVILDVEIIAALAPEADIFVYFAPNSDMGFYDAINKAIQDKCAIISISWGGAENSWDAATLNSYNTLFKKAADNNITILCAAGDNGSSDGSAGQNVDFPGSSPYALSCGGTFVQARGTVIVKETVWNVDPVNSSTGGGISSIFPVPAYQTSLSFPLNGKRGVPDISGNADPTSGYIIYGDGQAMVVGGTSAVSPLWSGLLARINQIIHKNVGFIQPLIYKSQGSACRDITEGNNGYYSAGAGWDACTGYGSPDGQKILALFK